MYQAGLLVLVPATWTGQTAWVAGGAAIPAGGAVMQVVNLAAVWWRARPPHGTDLEVRS